MNCFIKKYVESHVHVCLFPFNSKYTSIKFECVISILVTNFSNFCNIIFVINLKGNVQP